MTKRLHSFIALLVVSFMLGKPLYAQLSGISYNFSPVAEYHFWDNQAGLNDGLIYGGKVGFGFGEYLELSGIYKFSNSLETDFSDYGIPNFDENAFTRREVDFRRIGAELRANVSRSALRPFILVGTGVQSLQLEEFEENEQIYLNLGGGLTFNLDERVALQIEGQHNFYNFNPTANFLTAEDRTMLGLADADLEDLSLNNWSLGASLNIYLGGRKRGTLTDLDRAYMNTFRGGISVPFEPTLSFINWDDDLAYRDTWMAGIYAGFDFNQFIGIRGFYSRAMENEEITTDFDDLEMYGGELSLRLNQSKGVVPFITLGGGYINVDEESYLTVDSTLTASSSGFASGGLGLDLPLSPNFKLFGSAKALLTTDSDVGELQSTESVEVSTMYSFGIKLAFGTRNNPQAVLNQTVQEAVDDAIVVEQQRNLVESQAIKSQYELKILELEQQLNDAYQNQDINEAVNLLEQKKYAEKVVEELDDRIETVERNEMERKMERFTPSVPAPPSQGSRIELTPAEFQNLIDEIMENNGNGRQSQFQSSPPNYFNQPQVNNNARDQELDMKIQQLENLVQQLESRTAENAEQVDNAIAQALEEMENRQKQREVEQAYELRNRELQAKIKQLETTMSQQNSTNDQLLDQRMDEILQKIENTRNPKTPQEEFDFKMERLENLIQQVEKNGGNGGASVQPNNSNDQAAENLTRVSAQMLIAIKELSEDIEQNRLEIQQLNQPEVVYGKKKQRNPNRMVAVQTEEGTVYKKPLSSDTTSFFSRVYNNGVSVFAGPSFGEQFAFNVGLRGHYGLVNSRINFLPEIFYGFADPNAFGFGLNGTVDVDFLPNSPLRPYIGTGLGFINAERDVENNRELQFGINLLVGTYLNVANGQVYVDYTARNLFRYNQLAVGYRVNFGK